MPSGGQFTPTAPLRTPKRWKAAGAVLVIVFCPLLVLSSQAFGHSLKSQPKRHLQSRLRVALALIGPAGAAGSPTAFQLRVQLPPRDRLKRFTLTFGDGQRASGTRLTPRVSHVYASSGHFVAKFAAIDVRAERAVAALPVSVSQAAPSLFDALKGWTAAHPPVGDPSTGVQVPGSSEATLGPVENLFPGAVIVGDPTNIENGDLQPVPLAPGPGTVYLTDLQLPNDGKIAEHVLQGTAPAVNQAIQDLRGQKQFQPTGIDTSSLNFTEVKSSQQATTDLQASFSYAGLASASGSFSEADNQSEHHLLFQMTNTYYGVDYRPDYVNGHNDLDAFFARGTTATQATGCGCMSGAEPPMYVSHVTYGTSFYFLANSTADTQAMKDAISAAVHYGPIGGSASLSQSEQSTLDEMSIQAIAVGGLPSQVGNAMAGALGNGGSDITKWLTKFIEASTTAGAQASVPLSYTLSYLDGQRVGEFASQPPMHGPVPDGDIVDHVNIDVQMGSDDRTCSDPVTVSLIDNQGDSVISGLRVAGEGGSWNPCQTYSPYCPNPQWGSSFGGNGGADYWNNEQSGQPVVHCRIPLTHPIHVYNLAGAQLSISGPGDSWHAGFTVRVDLPPLAGNNGSGSYVAYVTKQNMFFNVDGGNGNPCADSPDVRASGYTLTLNEPTDGNAISAHCPAIIAG
jgi:hypothetical protein